ncbi:hypothetical protein ASPTUDRAFT_45762 [Aspergillus tubingensis CBS 134.48]|uniref:Uncharacterized protein n=1 Tax=Aspergillus tubingensis (strain CBS 134.48) TaxID=767770 RepID=A0A1L9MZ57_ASPTC|nr:hypothetical protein ASPTUDRAFT_45762 [Aspergillus tubingensis CBS 134.48]
MMKPSQWRFRGWWAEGETRSSRDPGSQEILGMRWLSRFPMMTIATSLYGASLVHRVSDTLVVVIRSNLTQPT